MKAVSTTSQPVRPLLQGRAPGKRGVLQKIRALVLLAGAMRTTRWSRAIGRSLLDLPIESGRTIFGQWLFHSSQLGRSLDSTPLAVRLMLDQASLMPRNITSDDSIRLRMERDPTEYRGVGGI